MSNEMHNTYDDIRPGDIVEFDADGEHYGPEPCYISDWGGFETDDESLLDYNKIPYPWVENIIIHRELRTREPMESGLYVTQSGIALHRLDGAITFPWNMPGKKWSDSSNFIDWDHVVSEIGADEFPLRSAKAVVE